VLCENSCRRYVTSGGIFRCSITGIMAPVRKFHDSTLSAVWNSDYVCIHRGFADLGKVLAGIQAPEEDSAQFGEFLRELGYPYVEETHNEVYKRYLRK
jgi:threonine dehydratase